ncbi:RDD family protein [Lysobacter sp. S4-A87]|uniref:RDD family protein n=1 Tax=Lysobacter sp. S4-A87 TaxID=2925843 RepID=UPI001F53D384|nr:RDD family protein [Lysobacter sp. S4-A87]UNK48425.1 RDD family protein [Lysobacter sp. S4-A87]
MESFEYRNPYAAPTAQVQPTAAERFDDEPTTAGRLPRLLAALVDGGVSMVIAIPAIIGALRYTPQRGIGELGGSLILLSVVGYVALIIYTLILLSREGQTIGKRVIGIRIVRTDGDRAGLGRLFWLRYFVPGLIGAVPYVGWIFSLANILWIFGEQRRCLHDHIADTMVVNV